MKRHSRSCWLQFSASVCWQAVARKNLRPRQRAATRRLHRARRQPENRHPARAFVSVREPDEIITATNRSQLLTDEL